MNSLRICVLLAALVVVVIHAYDCETNGDAGCSTFKKGSPSKVSNQLKSRRRSYDMKKISGGASGKHTDSQKGASTMDAQKKGSNSRAKISGSAKGTAALKSSTKKGKKLNQGATDKTRIAHIGNKGNGQIQKMFAKNNPKRKSANSVARIRKGNANNIQSQTAKTGSKKISHVVNQSPGTGQAKVMSKGSPNTIILSGAKKNSNKVSGTKYPTGKKPKAPAFDKDRFTAEHKEQGSKSSGSYTGPTNTKFLKGKNAIQADTQKTSSKDVTSVNAGNALFKSIAGNRATVGLTSEIDKNTNEVKSSSQIFGQNIDTGTSAKINSFKEKKCSGDFVNQDDTDANGFKVYKINEAKLRKESDGSYTFPSCMDIEAKVRIAAGYDLRNVAVSLSMNIPECGQYKCGPGRKCGNLECFYRNLCPDEPDFPSGNKFDDAGNFIATSVTDTNGCSMPLSNSARDFNLQFEYCPNQNADVKQKDVCNRNIFSLFRQFSGDKKSSMTVQLDMYYPDESFQCGDSGSALNKVACKQLFYDYTAKSHGVKGGGDNYAGGNQLTDCNNPSNSNHFLCQGL